MFIYRADYWKSNAKKYCEFCKCWIADNKISVSLHEDGRRHKDNVAKKISAITKQSNKDHKEKCKFDQEMAKMEKGAMAAYLKDIQNNADMTSQMINEKIMHSKRVHQEKPDEKPMNLMGESSKDKKKSPWQETKSDEGQIYYWNTVTNETVWEPPSEGFVSIAEVQVRERVTKPKPPPKKPQNKFNNKRGRGNKHNFTQRIIPKTRDPANIPDVLYYGPDTFKAPFGKWTKVVNIGDIDLQLPEQTRVPVVAPVIKIPHQEKQFKEKQIVTLDEDEEPSGSTFKKRKINNNAKRNTRQRLDDD